jgi:hypothetical protein
MIQQKSAEDVQVPLEDFTKYNRALFHDEDIQPDKYNPLTDPDHSLITPTELSYILDHKYKATKSRGLSILPHSS